MEKRLGLFHFRTVWTVSPERFRHMRQRASLFSSCFEK